ncbi:DUF1330 domain-containing protein [Flavobacteriaceae bacterium]|nr:DUF1330 domain-containing protein [Flavobacteriaceae bacterium]|tara:strand:- start:592 stop:1035 length:444 start_codon:yes stop_codon:yes gene_type:complete
MRTIENFVDPSSQNFAAFKALDRSTPIFMLNMLRFRQHAEYPSDHPLAANDMTGEQAYIEYGKTSGPIFSRVGGSIAWRGQPETVLIGPDDEHWDQIFIAHYPNAGAFLEMVTDPEYRKAVVNRQAAVQTSRLVRMGEAAIGNGFAS